MDPSHAPKIRVRRGWANIFLSHTPHRAPVLVIVASKQGIHLDFIPQTALLAPLRPIHTQPPCVSAICLCFQWKGHCSCWRPYQNGGHLSSQIPIWHSLQHGKATSQLPTMVYDYRAWAREYCLLKSRCDLASDNLEIELSTYL